MFKLTPGIVEGMLSARTNPATDIIPHFSNVTATAW